MREGGRNESGQIDQLGLGIEILKDLTPSASTSEAVRGGVTTGKYTGSYCGTW